MSGFIAMLGLVIICVGLLAMVPGFIGMVLDWSETIIKWSMVVCITGIMLGLVVMLLGLAFGGAKPSLVEGRCYQAVKHGSYVPITVSTGKSVVIVPSYTESIDLVEVRCE